MRSQKRTTKRKREREKGGEGKNRRFIEDEKVNKLGRALESVREDFRVGKHGAEWSVYVSPPHPSTFRCLLPSPYHHHTPSNSFLFLRYARTSIQSLATRVICTVFVALYPYTNNGVGRI